jgi:hypothetical protein
MLQQATVVLNALLLLELRILLLIAPPLPAHLAFPAALAAAVIPLTISLVMSVYSAVPSDGVA